LDAGWATYLVLFVSKNDKRFSRKDYRCIPPDLIGVGKSDKPIKEKYHTYDVHCQNILVFIQELRLLNIMAFLQDSGRLIGENPGYYTKVILVNGDLPLFSEEINSYFMDIISFFFYKLFLIII